MLTCRRLLPLLLLGIVVGGFLPAAPKPTPPPAPAAPEKYDVVVRYLIQSFRNERVRRYFRMIEDLRLAGFTRSPTEIPSEIEPEDSRATRLSGSLARQEIARVLNQPDVQALLLVPAGMNLPAKDAAVRVNLRLAGNLPPARQRDLHAQVRQALAGIGFTEAVGYDHLDYTRVLGQISVGGLNTVLDDLRRQPSAWSQLPGSLLADLRKAPNGTDLIDRVIEDWGKVPAGRKLLLDNIKQWETYQAAIAYFRTLPFEVTQNPTLFTELQIHHFARHPDSAELLGKLFTEVRKDAAGPELMDLLLTRIGGAGLDTDLPILFRAAPPVRIVETQPQLPLPAAPLAPVEIPAGQEKFSNELRALLADAAEAGKARRYEFVLRSPPPDLQRNWADRFAALPVAVEGRVGGVVTVFGPATAAPVIAAIADVVAVRLPLRASEARDPARELKADTASSPGCRATAALLRQYADAGRLRQVVVIGADFRAWETFKGNQLPGTTRMLDLTSERNRTIEPDPYVGDPKEPGPGTKAALALVNLAATSDLVLVRIDPEAAYQVDYLARITAGVPEVSLNLAARLRDLGADRSELETRAERLLEERNRVLFDFRPEAEQLRADYAQRQAKYDADRKEFAAREKRYLSHESLTNSIRKMRVVWNTLTFDEGYPLFDTGATSRFLDDHPYPGVWLQSRGDDGRRVWFGMWNDTDSSGALDLLATDRPWSPGRWSPDLGFLTWTNEKGEPVAQLPAGTVVRLAMQWKEIHDADLARMDTDPYLAPLARLGLQVFRQLDPTGKTQPADDLALLVQSVGAPVRLLKTPRFAVYEVAVELKVETPGRYLLRIEGAAPDGTRPRDLPTLPAARESWELRPRLVVRTLAGPGIASLEDGTPERPALPMPADARRAVILGER